MSKELSLKVRAKIEKLVGQKFGARVRGISDAVIIYGEDDLTDEQMIRVVRVAESIEELRNPELLFGHFVKEFTQTPLASEAWRNIAIKLLDEYLIEEKVIDLPTVRTQILSGISNVADFLSFWKNPERHDFVINSGEISIEGEKFAVVALCPASSLAKKWFSTALAVIDRIEREKQAA